MHPIERYRKVKGLTQVELGQKVGVSVTSVKGWENGREPRPRHLVKLAEVLGVDPMALFREMEHWQATDEGQGKGEAAPSEPNAA